MAQVTIIIPCYNYEQFIGDCVKSCLEQDFQDVNVLVVDDCSTDKSREVVRAVDDKRVGLLKTEINSGYSTCKNVGIAFNKSPFIVHIDADDMLTPSSITSRLKVFEENPGVELVHGYALKIHGNVTYEECVRDHNKLKRHPSRLHAQGLMVRKEVYDKYGLYYTKLRSKADKEMLFRWGVHDMSPLRKRVNIKRCHSEVAYYRRHDNAMHKMRKVNKDYEREVRKIFKRRLHNLMKNGITRENTEWL